MNVPKPGPLVGNPKHKVRDSKEARLKEYGSKKQSQLRADYVGSGVTVSAGILGDKLSDLLHYLAVSLCPGYSYKFFHAGAEPVAAI